jgi:Glycosyl transferase family 2
MLDEVLAIMQGECPVLERMQSKKIEICRRQSQPTILHKTVLGKSSQTTADMMVSRYLDLYQKMLTGAGGETSRKTAKRTMTATHHATSPDEGAPYFSVIIPCFRSVAVLRDALDSVLVQDEPFEVIVVDGGSDDDTAAIARAHPSHPVVISEPDEGIYDAVNKGMALATGRLIGVLGSDDTFEPRVFSRLRARHVETGADIVFGAARMVDAAGNAELRKDEPYGPGALISGIPFCHNAMFVTPETFAAVGPYDHLLRICADAEWVHRAIKTGRTAAGITDVVVTFSLGGLSTVNVEEIMTETYRIIAANFGNVTPDEGKILINAARRWGPVEPALEIAARHPDDTLLQTAVAHALSAAPSILPRDGGGLSVPRRLARGLLKAVGPRRRIT